MAYRIPLSQIKDGETGFKNIIGIVSDQTKIAVLSTSGLGLCFEHPAARKYLTMKLSDTDLLVSAIGVNGALWVWNDVKCQIHRDIETHRNGSKGVYLLPRQKATYMVSVPKNGIVMSSNGILTAESICKETRVFVVGTENLVFYDDKKEIHNKEETKDLVLTGKVEAVFVLL